MPFSTLIKYLLGDKHAILEVAHSRSAIWIGLMLVLSAGLAREYDHESLLHEPWHVLIPLGASSVVALALFVLFYLIRPREGAKRPPFFQGLRIVLALVWMTAPLAWLYAIPYERMLDAGGATRANLWTLAIVATWRVLLISRALAVVLRMKSLAAFFIVMLLADAVALTMLAIVPLPIINFMGGIALSESESLIASTSLTVMALGWLSAAIWFIGAASAIGVCRTDWVTQANVDQTHQQHGRLWIAAASVVIGACLLPFTQPPQALRHRVERGLRRGDVSDAVAVMSAHEVNDFPPHWDPPPRRGYGERDPNLHLIIEEIERQESPAWIRQTYIRKAHEQARSDFRYFWARGTWPEVAERVKKYEAFDDVDRARSTLGVILRIDRDLTSEDRAAIEGLLAMTKPVDPDTEPSERD